VTVSGSDLLCWGRVQDGGGNAANRIAKWDGNGWSALGSGMAGCGLYSLAVLGNDLYVGGFFATVGGRCPLTLPVHICCLFLRFQSFALARK